MPALVITGPDGKVRTHYLIQTETRIGSADCHIVLPEPDVAAYHCVVIDRGGMWVLVDKSDDGITVGGRWGKYVQLLDGDSFRVGTYGFRFDLNAAPRTNAAACTGVFVSGTDVMPDPKTAASGLVGRLTVEGIEKQPFYLGPGTVAVGSDSANDVVVNRKFVSARHFSVFAQNGKNFIKDVGSRNGTSVNGVRLTVREVTPLPDDSKIIAGQTLIKFKLVPKPSQRPLPPRFMNMVGDSPAMHKVFEFIKQVAPTDARVFITGETGTGKELVARAIHDLSKRSGQSYMAFNCANMPRELVESFLFGYVKGAFTGAQFSRAGVFEMAQGGTLFLDELGEMPLEAQAKLLRVVQEGEVMPVGETKAKKVNVRLIAATNRDLYEAARRGEFREDLLNRLDVLRMALPSLKDRGEDVLLLAEQFMIDHGGDKTLGEAAIRRIRNVDWTGNVRVLFNALERAIALSPTDVIGPEVLDIKAATLEQRLTSLKADRPGRTLDEITKEAILQEYNEQGQNQSRTAKVLDIGLTTLKRKLKEYNVGAVDEAA